MHFTHSSLFWWGIPLGALVFVMALRSASALSSVRTGVALALRGLLVLLVLAALAGPGRRYTEPEPHAVVYVVDLSASVSDATRETVLSQLTALSERLRGPSLRQALIGFAGRADVLDSSTGLRDEAFPNSAARRTLRAETEAKALAARATRVLEGSPSPEQRAAAEADVHEAQALRDGLARMEPGRTDLDDALTLAMNLFPDVSDRQLVVYTDANVNAGRFGRGSPSDAPGGGRPGPGVRIALCPVGDEAARDVVAESLSLPTEVRVGEAFDARVALSARSPLKAKVALLLDDAPLVEQSVEFATRGRQAVVFPNLQLTDGFHRFRVAVEAEGETERRNNRLLGAVLATGRERVLIAEALPQAGSNVEAALAAQDVVVERQPARALPTTAADLASWGAVVLAEGVHESLSRDQWHALERYVADAGGGLVFLSGSDARGLAGFKGSPEEALLPVTFDPPRPEDQPAPPAPQPKPEPEKHPDPRRRPQRAEVETPSVALLLAIDKSGSMAGKKMNLAKEAAIAAAEALKEEDQIGVLGFDEKPRWVLEFTSARKRTVITDRVSRILAGGGTEIYPALQEAGRALLRTNAQVKHIILLTDGYTAMADFQNLVVELARQKITVSSIGIGEEFDGTLLSSIARWGHGRYYFTENFDEIPQLFVRETRTAVRAVASRTPPPPVSEHTKPEEATPALTAGGPGPDAQPPGAGKTGPDAAQGAGGAGAGTGAGGRQGPRGPFPVVEKESLDLLKGIPSTPLPVLEQLARSQLRQQAVLCLATSDENMPVLALARYGLGKVAVWTSDLRGEGAPAWVAWPSFSKFLGQLVRSVGRSSEERALHPEVEVRYEGSEAVLTVRAPEERESENLRVETAARCAPPDARPEPVPVEKVGVSQYRIRVPIPETGKLYTLDLFQRVPGGVERSTTLGLARPYEEEYHDLGLDPQRVDACARRLGAKVNPPFAELAAILPRLRTRSQNLAWIFLLAAVLLLPVDVAVRRVGV
ncbi:MAG: VWA domain-containing protein [Planctomycetes bacterium]|nr:VWA domain-containing protein [Planctomycetota bacterium]